MIIAKLGYKVYDWFDKRIISLGLTKKDQPNENNLLSLIFDYYPMYNLIDKKIGEAIKLNNIIYEIKSIEVMDYILASLETKEEIKEYMDAVLIPQNELEFDIQNTARKILYNQKVLKSLYEKRMRKIINYSKSMTDKNYQLTSSREHNLLLQSTSHSFFNYFTYDELEFFYEWQKKFLDKYGMVKGGDWKATGQIVLGFFLRDLKDFEKLAKGIICLKNYMNSYFIQNKGETEEVLLWGINPCNAIELKYLCWSFSKKQYSLIKVYKSCFGDRAEIAATGAIDENDVNGLTSFLKEIKRQLK